MRSLFVMGILSGLFSGGAGAKEGQIKVGGPAPQIRALDEGGREINLNYDAEFTMVYFYPKADTPGCTAQACSLRDSYEELTKKGVKVYGVSTDTPEAQKKFKEKYKLPFTLIADTDRKVAEAFSVPVKMGFSSRQAFLIKDKKFVWIDRSASTKEQAQDVLKFLEPVAKPQ